MMERKWKLLYYNRIYLLGLYWDNGKENGSYFTIQEYRV